MTNHKTLVHGKMFLYQCKICARKLKCWQSARFHVLMHSETPPFQCAQCGMTFTGHAQKQRHRVKGHPGMKATIKKVLLSEHHELVEKAIKKIDPEPIPKDYQPSKVSAQTISEWKKLKLADMVDEEKPKSILS